MSSRHFSVHDTLITCRGRGRAVAVSLLQNSIGDNESNREMNLILCPKVLVHVPGFRVRVSRTVCIPNVSPEVELQIVYGYSVAGNVLVIGAFVTLCWDAVVL